MAVYQVSASSDDVYRRLVPSTISLNNIYNEAGALSTTGYKAGSGMRFNNILIAQGAIISTAYLTFRAGFSNSKTVVNTRISAEDVDNAPTFLNDAAVFDTRWAARTTARVDWDAISTWINGNDYNSPEIKTVIQEIVDRAGWVSGNSIVIFWDDYDDRSTHANDVLRQGIAWDAAGGSNPNAPKLIINPTFIHKKGAFIPRIIMLE